VEDIAGLGLAGTGTLAASGAETATRLARLADTISAARSVQATQAARSWDLSAAIWLAISADRWDAIAQHWQQTATALEGIERYADRAGAALGAWQTFESNEERCAV
jgi:hypothetical protein